MFPTEHSTGPLYYSWEWGHQSTGSNFCFPTRSVHPLVVSGHGTPFPAAHDARLGIVAVREKNPRWAREAQSAQLSRRASLRNCGPGGPTDQGRHRRMYVCVLQPPPLPGSQPIDEAGLVCSNVPPLLFFDPCPSMQLFPTVYVPSSTWPLQPTSQPARMKKAFQLAGVYIFGWKPGHE